MKDINQFIQENNIIFAINCTRNASTWNTYGDDSKLSYKGILAEYFSTPKKLANTFDWIKNAEIIPQIVNQKPVNCFLTQVRSGEIWALFTEEKFDVMEIYQRTQEMHNELKKIQNNV